MIKNNLNINNLYNKYKHFSQDIYFFASILIASSLFFSRFLISLAFILVIINSIVEGRFKEKYKFIKENKAPFYIVLLLVFHLVGLLYTQNLEEGILDIKNKSFLFFIIAYGTGVYMNKTRTNIVFNIYILSAIIASIISTLNFYLNNEVASIEDIGGITLVGGNLYQGIFINFAISILSFFLISNKKIKYPIIYYFIIIWFVIYLFILNSLTGYALLFIVFIYNSYFLFFKLNNKKSKLIIFSIFSTSIILIGIFLSSFIIDFYKTDDIIYNTLPKTTINGNAYIHDTIKSQRENGHYVNLYLCKKELQKEWNNRSTLSYNGLDKKQQHISQTLIRYLSSKKLTKDSIGVWKLTSNEINLIENGCANYLYANKLSIRARIYLILWQLDNYFNNNFVNRQTISQRLVYYKVAVNLIKNNFWIGLGPGDIQYESNKYIALSNVGISKEYSNRVHNQFLIEFLGLGVFGFIGFIFIFFYSFFLNKKWNDYLFTSFYLIITTSFFSEFLLETQLGMAFFSFFYSILFFNQNQQIKKTF